MLIGAHSILYSKNPDADRAFLRDVLALSHVDVGGGWLIFGLPPSEVAVHPADTSRHELYLMVDSIDGFVEEMKARGIATSELHHERWGILTQVTLPGGGELGVYEPLHARPKAAAPKTRAAKKPAKKPAAKKPAAKKPAAKKPTAKKPTAKKPAAKKPAKKPAKKKR